MLARTIRRLLSVALIALVTNWITISPGYAAPAAQAGIAANEFTITLGDNFQTKARLDYPANASGRLPTVILIHGGAPADMDFTYPPPDLASKPLSTVLKDIGLSLAGQGIAVLRYNKRYVTGPGQFDADKYFKLALTDFVDDAARVLEAARTNPRVDPNRIFIYGWSEGSLVGAALAARTPNLAGVIFQGTVAFNERQSFIDDYLDVVLPNALRYAPDGRITPDTIKAVQAGDGGFLAKGAVIDFTDSTITDTIKVNPLLDTNGDGVLEAKGEIKPNLGKLVDESLKPGGYLSTQVVLPSVSQQGPQIKMPVLVLQGELDQASRAKYRPLLDKGFAGNHDYTYKLYPGLGHSLGNVPSLLQDDLVPIAAQPLADMGAWINAHSQAGPRMLPTTDGDMNTNIWLLVGVALLACLGGGVMMRKRRET